MSVDTENQGESLSVARAAHILQSNRRRSVIELLAEYGPLTTAELADRIAGGDQASAINDLESRDLTQSIRVGLQEDHLPKLLEMRVIGEADPSEDIYHLEKPGHALCQAVGAFERALEEASA